MNYKKHLKMRPILYKIICRVCGIPTIEYQSIYGSELCEDCDEALEVVVRRDAIKCNTHGE